MRPIRACVACSIVPLSMLAGAPAAAQSIEPRAYSPAPVGTNFLIAAYSESSGAMPIDPALPLSDIDLRIRGVAIGYARSLDLLGKSAKIDFVLPVGRLQGEATFSAKQWSVM